MAFATEFVYNYLHEGTTIKHADDYFDEVTTLLSRLIISLISCQSLGPELTGCDNPPFVMRYNSQRQLPKSFK